MRVREHDRIDLARFDRRRVPVAQAQLLESFEQPAVDQDPLVAGGEQVFRSSDRAGGAEKLNVELCGEVPIQFLYGMGAVSGELHCAARLRRARSRPLTLAKEAISIARKANRSSMETMPTRPPPRITIGNRRMPFSRITSMRARDAIAFPSDRELGRHDVADDDHLRIEAFRHDTHHDIAIRDDAAWDPAPIQLFHHDDITHVSFSHQACSFRCAGVPPRGDHFSCAYGSDRHCQLPPASSSSQCDSPTRPRC